MNGCEDHPKVSCTSSIFIAYLVSIPVVIAARMAGVSGDVSISIMCGAIAALSPIVFMILRARHRREWMKKWQGPAYMYRRVPPAPAQVAGGFLVEDRGYLKRLLPGYRYQFADDPSGYFLTDFVLLGTWAAIMEFLEKHQEEMIENNSSIPTAGIYMTVKTYQPIKRYRTSGGLSIFTVQWLKDLLSSIVPVGNPVADFLINVGELDQALKSLHEYDADDGNQIPAFSPWIVFTITFSVLKSKGFHFIGKHSVDFGSIRHILKSGKKEDNLLMSINKNNT